MTFHRVFLHRLLNVIFNHRKKLYIYFIYLKIIEGEYVLIFYTFFHQKKLILKRGEKRSEKKVGWKKIPPWFFWYREKFEN